MQRLPLALIAALTLAATVQGDDLRWTNPTGGSFHDVTNWDPPRVPVAGDTAVFDLPNTYTVTLAAEIDDVHVRSVAGDVTVQLADLTWGGAIVFAHGDGPAPTLTLANGQFELGSDLIDGNRHNPATLALHEAALLTTTIQITGLRLLALGGHLASDAHSIHLTAVDAEFRGPGSYLYTGNDGMNSTGLNLQDGTALIVENEAWVSGAERLSIDGTSRLEVGAGSHAGNWETWGEGTLIVRDGGFATGDSIGGVRVGTMIVSGEGSRVEFCRGGDRVVVENGGSVVGDYAGWWGGTLTVRGPGATAEVGNWQDLDAVIEVLDGGHLSASTLTCPVTARGEGTTVGGSDELLIDFYTGGNDDTRGSLVLEDGASIDATRVYVEGPVTFRNGTFNAVPLVMWSGSVTVEPDATVTVAEISAQTDASFHIEGVLSAPPITFGSGWYISGDGTLASDLDLGWGGLRPGPTYPELGLATLTIAGDLTGYRYSTWFDIDIGPAGASDRIIAENIDLDGGLHLHPAPGYTPALGDRFTIFQAQSITGLFDEFGSLPTAPQGLAYRIVYEPTSITVAVVCPGDWNADGAADAEDFAAFRDSFLAGDWQADLDNSHGLDVGDFTAFRNAYLAGCP